MNNGYTIRLTVEEGILKPVHSNWYQYYYAVRGRDDELLDRFLFLKVSHNLADNTQVVGEYLQAKARRMGLIADDGEGPVYLYRVVRGCYGTLICRDAATAEKLSWLNGITMETGVTIWMKRHIEYHGRPAKYANFTEFMTDYAIDRNRAMSLGNGGDTTSSSLSGTDSQEDILLENKVLKSKFQKLLEYTLSLKTQNQDLKQRLNQTTVELGNSCPSPEYTATSTE